MRNTPREPVAGSLGNRLLAGLGHRPGRLEEKIIGEPWRQLSNTGGLKNSRNGCARRNFASLSEAHFLAGKAIVIFVQLLC
jgi:hypothetical protein